MSPATIERRDHCQTVLNGGRISARIVFSAEVVACGGNKGMEDGGQRAWRGG